MLDHPPGRIHLTLPEWCACFICVAPVHQNALPVEGNLPTIVAAVGFPKCTSSIISPMFTCTKSWNLSLELIWCTILCWIHLIWSTSVNCCCISISGNWCSTTTRFSPSATASTIWCLRGRNTLLLCLSCILLCWTGAGDAVVCKND